MTRQQPNPVGGAPPKVWSTPWALLLSAAALGALVGCGHPADEAVAPPHTVVPDLPPREIELVARIPYLVTYPCSSLCHDAREPMPGPRELVAFHTERQLQHGEGIVWCDFCHTLEDPDYLHLLDGTRFTFDESDRLCGQCHGPQHRDWSEGLHGITIGRWYGTAQRKLCTACHDPHTPGKITLESLPPPSAAPNYSQTHVDVEEGGW